jgi:hypothetical protein
MEHTHGAPLPLADIHATQISPAVFTGPLTDFIPAIPPPQSVGLPALPVLGGQLLSSEIDSSGADV